MKTKLWNLGYLVAIGLLAVLLITNPEQPVKTALLLLFAVTLSVSFSRTVHRKMMKKDRDYRRDVKDERNILIKNKANALNSALLLLFVGIAALVLLLGDHRGPALLVGSIIPLDLILLPVITKYYEKQY